MKTVLENVDRQKLLDSCPCGCSCEFQDIFEYIDAHDADEDIIAKYLGFYVNQKWLEFCKHEKFYAFSAEAKYEEKVIEALRAMADAIESGVCKMIFDADIPKLPIFSDESNNFAEITVSIAKNYPGG